MMGYLAERQQFQQDVDTLKKQNACLLNDLEVHRTASQA